MHHLKFYVNNNLERFYKPRKKHILVIASQNLKIYAVEIAVSFYIVYKFWPIVKTIKISFGLYSSQQLILKSIIISKNTFRPWLI